MWGALGSCGRPRRHASPGPHTRGLHVSRAPARLPARPPACPGAPGWFQSRIGVCVWREAGGDRKAEAKFPPTSTVPCLPKCPRGAGEAPQKCCPGAPLHALYLYWKFVPIYIYLYERTSPSFPRHVCTWEPATPTRLGPKPAKSISPSRRARGPRLQQPALPGPCKGAPPSLHPPRLETPHFSLPASTPSPGKAEATAPDPRSPPRHTDRGGGCWRARRCFLVCVCCCCLN